ncbi:hypothetical protein OPV22_034500 [Ensete ventricosum]|uniref:Uncharacterized protein n=1 Tax=Ensete ventricosum TaxID=4639 RepID=A0AAV8PPS4_ENSVE|nr:hypothetical protein OPV22_034500 [Ensete ventricosum]
MTPDEADAVVIGSSSPGNLPTIGAAIPCDVKVVLGLQCYSFTDIFQSGAVCLPVCPTVYRSLWWFAGSAHICFSAFEIRDHLLALLCGLDMDKKLKMDWRREMVGQMVNDKNSGQRSYLFL